MREEDGQYVRLTLTHMPRMVQILHHAKVLETAITRLPNTDPNEMISIIANWDKDLASGGMKAKVNGKCHISFFSPGRLRLARL